MSEYRDCRTCRHNSYLGIESIVGWFDCSHPITFEKRTRWANGDPAMVNYRTGDVPLSQIHHFAHCPAWEDEPHD